MDHLILTERLKIRSLELADAESMFSYRSDPTIARFQSWEPASLSEVQEVIARLTQIGIDTPGSWYQLGLFLRATRKKWRVTSASTFKHTTPAR